MIVRNGEEKEGGRVKPKTQTKRRMRMKSTRMRRVGWMRMKTFRKMETGRREPSSGR